MRYRCPECRTRRTDGHLMVMHQMACKRPVCDCRGYEYRHRPGSRYCTHSERGDLNHALRSANNYEERLTITAEWAWDTPGVMSNECPF